MGGGGAVVLDWSAFPPFCTITGGEVSPPLCVHTTLRCNLFICQRKIITFHLENLSQCKHRPAGRRTTFRSSQWHRRLIGSNKFELFMKTTSAEIAFSHSLIRTIISKWLQFATAFTLEGIALLKSLPADL